MDKPEDHYSRNTQPQCSESVGWPVVDGIFAALNVIGAISLSSDDRYSSEQKTGYVLGGVAWGLIHTASALSGVGYASKCTEAKAEYNDAPEGITPTEERRRRAYEAHEARQEAKEQEAMRREAAMKRPAAPRGFFCTSSPSNAAAGICVRDKDECGRTRDAALVGVSDLTECTLTERAFCFGDRCAPSAEACDAMRSRVLGPDGTGPECADSE